MEKNMITIIANKTILWNKSTDCIFIATKLTEETQCKGSNREHIVPLGVELTIPSLSSEWIPVTEGLPERKDGWNHSDTVWLFYQGNEHDMETCGVGYYHYEPPFEKHARWIDFHYSRGRQPSHWMPIPELPSRVKIKDYENNERS
jgi:hypothetical protein